MAQGFRWHSEARLFGPDGAETRPAGGFAALPTVLPGAEALRAVLAGVEGAAFRIGGTGALEAATGEFETLTGGSLGQPRRVRRRQASWLASMTVNARLFGIGPGLRLAVPGQLVHSLALYGGLEGLCLGAEVHLLEGLRPDRQAVALTARQIGLLYATPAQLQAMVAAEPSWPALRTILIGGAKLTAPLRAALIRAAPQAEIREFYGAAETSFITLAVPADDPASVGQPYPGVSLRLDGQGQVWVQSPYLFAGYAGPDPGGARWEDGWLTVGEYGQMTSGGLVLRGRAGRMVTIAGQNVFPEEIEQFLGQLPGIQRAAVLALPDPARGHVLVAHVMGDAGQEAALMRALRERLGPMLAPRRLIWRADWPVLPSGKTDLAALAEEGATWR